MKANELYAEIEESLLRGLELFRLERELEPDENLKEFCRERARNLAMALASRTLSNDTAASVEFCDPPMGGTLEEVKNDLEGK